MRTKHMFGGAVAAIVLALPVTAWATAADTSPTEPPSLDETWMGGEVPEMTDHWAEMVATMEAHCDGPGAQMHPQHFDRGMGTMGGFHMGSAAGAMGQDSGS